MNKNRGPVLNKPNARSPEANAETEITLGLLDAVEEDSALTQRSVARRLGIALGLTNAYLKRCVRKGLIKITQVPPNRYAYYLTPKGFAEKSRLTAEYLSSSFQFFRRARDQCARLFDDCARRNWRRVALVGISDLAEIATLSAPEYGVTLVGVVDEKEAGERFAGLLVVATLSELGEVDAVLVTDLRAPQAAFEALSGRLPDERILTPRLLRVTRDRPGLDEQAVAGAIG